MEDTVLLGEQMILIRKEKKKNLDLILFYLIVSYDVYYWFVLYYGPYIVGSYIIDGWRGLYKKKISNFNSGQMVVYLKLQQNIRYYK
jgi:hypothetical protein